MFTYSHRRRGHLRDSWVATCHLYTKLYNVFSVLSCSHVILKGPSDVRDSASKGDRERRTNIDAEADFELRSRFPVISKPY